MGYEQYPLNHAAADNFWDTDSEHLWFRLSSRKLQALSESVANYLLRPLFGYLKLRHSSKY